MNGVRFYGLKRFQSNDYRAVLLLFALLLSLYSLTYSGTFLVDDEHIVAARGQSLAYWGKLYYPQVFGNDRVRHLAAVLPEQADPDVAMDPGFSLLAAPLYLLARGLNLGGTQTVMSLTPLLTAFTAVLLYFLFRRMSLGGKEAWIGAAVFGAGTMAWPFANRFYRDTLNMLMVLLAFYGWSMIWQARPSRSRVWGWICLLLGILGGVLAKRTALLLIPAFVVALAVLSRRRWRVIIAGGVIFLVILALSLLIPERGALSRFAFENLLQAAIRMWYGISPAAAAAVVGPFLSPAKSIFLFSPVLLFGLYGLIRFVRANAVIYLPALIFMGLLALSQALFHREIWAGVPLWGLRYMLPAVPLLALGMAPVLEWFLGTGERQLMWLAGGVFLVSVVIQVSGAVVSWHIPLELWLRAGLDPYAPAASWDPRFFAVPLHLSSLPFPERWDVGWVRTSGVDPLALLLPFAGLVMIGAAFRGTIGAFEAVRERATNRSGLRGAVMLAGAALIGVVLLPPALLARDPALGGNRPEYREAYELLEGRVESEDLVLVDDYGSTLWAFFMNRWGLGTPWYSLPHARSPTAAGSAPSWKEDPHIKELLDDVGQEYGEVWLVESDGGSGVGSGTGRYLLDLGLRRVSMSLFEGESVLLVSRLVQYQDMGYTLLSRHRLHSAGQIDLPPRHRYPRHNILNAVLPQIVATDLIEAEVQVIHSIIHLF